MLNIPMEGDMDAIAIRVQRVVETAEAERNCETLRELWCLLRNAEMKRGDERNKLHQMREAVAENLARLEAIDLSQSRTPASSSQLGELADGVNTSQFPGGARVPTRRRPVNR